MCDLIVSHPDHCLSFYSGKIVKFQSRKIIDVLSFLICLNFDLSETF